MESSEDQAPSASSAALLLIIGEPFSEDHKTLILEEITRGFRSWDKEDTGVDINEELSQIANRASLGEEGVNGERLIQHQSENLTVEILVNPLAQTVKNSFKKLLIAPSPTKYVIYAGHAFQGSGAWVLQDDVFAFTNLSQVFKSPEVESALKQNIEANLTIHTLAESHWGNSISKADFTNHVRIQLNPQEKLDNIQGVTQFTAYLGTFLTVTKVTDLLQASEQFGNISFTRPTLYIFPGCQGDSALFGINGFNLLVNGGYNRKACFWDFARHLDRVDAMLLTHLGTDNIFGINTALQRKTLENIHPQIGYLYFNGLDKAAPINEGSEKEPSLLINLAEEANKLTGMAKQLGIAPHPCLRPEKAPVAEPINLYHKLGHGSLDMYILNPIGDSKELKELFQLWGKQASNLGTSGPFPLQNAMSVCTLLVWKPYNPTEKIVRIFFPGNAPQHKIAEGLEKMKTFAFLKHASCTAKDLVKPPAVKKGTSARPGSSNSTARGSARSAAASSRSETSRTGTVSSPRKPEVPRARPTSATSPTKASRPLREEKTAKPKERAETKARPPSGRLGGAASPSKAGSTSPRKTPSPVKGASGTTSPTKASSPAKSPSPPKASSPPKSPPKSPTKAKSVEKSPDKEIKTKEEAPVVKKEDGQLINHTEQVDAGKEKSPLISESSAPVIAPLPTKPVVNGDSSPADLSSPVQLNGDTEEEEIRPQALPEPLEMVLSPSQESQESPRLPDYSAKMETDQQELSEFSKAELELEQLSSLTEDEPVNDPAQDIPSSPEPAALEDQDFVEPPSPKQTELFKGFEAPVFTNDEPNGTNGEAMEQKIQYGIDESHRAMAGIQEVDEEETDEGAKLDAQTLREMGIYEEDDEEEEEEQNPFENDEAEDEVRQNVREPSEEIEKQNEEPVEKDQDKDEEEVVSDNRTSAERQFEDVEETNQDEGIGDVEGIEQDSSLPAAFDKDSSPERDDADSLDGEKPDSDMNDEKLAYQQNGTSGKEHSPDLEAAASKVNPAVGKLDTGDSDEELQDGTFDPVSQWGHPMGLPSPPPPSDKGRGATSPTKSATDRRPASAATTKARSGPTSTARNGGRPATAPAKTAGRPATTRRAGSSRSSPQTAKIPPLPPLTPFYMDLTYIPNHGDPSYSDIEFFKRVRARYYVLSALSPNPKVLDSLMEAKATWEQKDLEVTLIPTYDNETLRHWMGLNKEKLQELRIDMTPAVSRCTIQLQDLETSLPAYRLEV